MGAARRTGEWICRGGHVAKDESLTFDANTEGAPVRANQYVVLVNGK